MTTISPLVNQGSKAGYSVETFWDGKKYVKLPSKEKSVRDGGDETSIVWKTGKENSEGTNTNPPMDITLFILSGIIGITAFYYIYRILKYNF